MPEELEELTAQDFVKDRVKARKEIENLRQGNVDRINTLRVYGGAVDPGLLANLKIDTFIDAFLDQDAKLVYHRNLEVALRKALDEALGKARTSQIVDGLKTSTKLSIPK